MFDSKIRCDRHPNLAEPEIVRQGTMELNGDFPEHF
jgi:hypothetical protein